MTGWEALLLIDIGIVIPFDITPILSNGEETARLSGLVGELIRKRV